MTDKVQKIKDWIQTRKLCTMDEHMKFYCKEAESDYNLLCSIEKILDSLQEEPVSEDLEGAAWFYADMKAYLDKSVFTPKEVNEKRIKLEYNWEDIRIAFKAGAKWQKTKDESTTEDLGGYINELSKQFPEVSFAKLSRIAVRVAKWKEQQLMANAVEGVVHHFEKCKVASVHYNDPTGVPMAYFTSPEGLSAGDKVKIITIKKK